MPQRQLLPSLKIGERVKCNEVVRAVNSLCEDIISKRDEIYIFTCERYTVIVLRLFFSVREILVIQSSLRYYKPRFFTSVSIAFL